jgi:chromosome segregation ATPase
METLIAVFSGVAFLALIVYLWNSDPAAKHDKDEAIKEAPSSAGVNEPNESTSPTLQFEDVAQLNPKIEASKTEHAEAFNEGADYTQKASVNHLDLQEAQASADDRSSQRVVELETDNSLLQRRLAELSSLQSSRESEMALLEQELAKLRAFEQEVENLQKEKAQLTEQLAKSEIENAANARASVALQDLEAKQSEFEGKLTSLREENTRLLAEISELRSSLRDKIKTQLDGLQELYSNLTPGLN